MYQQQPYQTGMNMPTQYDPYQYGGAGYGNQPKVRFPSKNEIISTVARMISPYVEPVVVLIDEEVRMLPHICKVPPLEWKLERITIPYSFDGQTVWNVTCYTHHASHLILVVLPVISLLLWMKLYRQVKICKE